MELEPEQDVHQIAPERFEVSRVEDPNNAREFIYCVSSSERQTPLSFHEDEISARDDMRARQRQQSIDRSNGIIPHRVSGDEIDAEPDLHLVSSARLDEISRGTGCVVIAESGKPCDETVVFVSKDGSKGACVAHSFAIAVTPSGKKRAEERVGLAAMSLSKLALPAVATLQDLMSDPDTSDAVRLKASTEVLDRLGLKSADRVEMNVTAEDSDGGDRPSDVIAQRLAALAAVPPAEAS
ncbi:hypothetical protein N9D66_00215 [Candidatus Nanopelagicales bacterium]|nr:hypothetical protein [Candidatus Nanopelagicales bacterium]